MSHPSLSLRERVRVRGPTTLRLAKDQGMHTLIIRHLGSTGDQHRCQVWRPDGRYAEEAVITAPEALQVEGRPESNLSLDLRWYLEEFLDYPFPPRTEVAERVQASLKAWGEGAFEALFRSGRGRDFYNDAYRAGLENLTLKIASDDPRVLAWPWEALRDPQTGGTLANHCQHGRASCSAAARSGGFAGYAPP